MAPQRRRKMVFVDLWTDLPPSDPVGVFCRQCSPIYMLYTHGLHASPTKIAATASWMRIFPISGAVRTTNRDVDVDEEPPDNLGLSEAANALIDARMTGLPPEQCGAAYLGWLHDVMLRFAEVRGWDTEPLAFARQFCLDRGLRAYFESRPRQSPDRRHKAVLSLEIDTDGMRHLALTVSEKTVVVAHRDQVVPTVLARLLQLARHPAKVGVDGPSTGLRRPGHRTRKPTFLAVPVKFGHRPVVPSVKAGGDILPSPFTDKRSGSGTGPGLQSQLVAVGVPNGERPAGALISDVVEQHRSDGSLGLGVLKVAARIVRSPHDVQRGRTRRDDPRCARPLDDSAFDVQAGGLRGGPALDRRRDHLPSSVESTHRAWIRSRQRTQA